MYGIVADVVHDRVLRPGAKVRILSLGGDTGFPLVAGPSKDGGMIAKATRAKRLCNFRAVWVGPDLREQWLHLFDTKEQALQAAHRLMDGRTAWS